ncbi:MAG: hypothetical protein K0Q48_1854 [Bacillota bacterium]|nr:hypothetical protein [Bacillota bacterium]
MSEKYERLLSPLKVGAHTYKNRMIASPIYCGPFVKIPPLRKMFFHEFAGRAAGGYAQVTIGETAVDFEFASREPFPPIDYTNLNDPAAADLKQVADDIKNHGGKAMIELSHCGESMLKLPGLKDLIGPTGFLREDGATIIEMDEALMEEVIDHFITASRFMKNNGFDGVLIHAGHGWLLHQFLSSRTNKRTDEYGGTLENRAKFPARLIRAVREAMGEDFLLEIRVSGDEMTEGGMGIEETAAFCKMIERYADMIHVSVGLYRDPILSGQFSSLFHPHGLNADLAAEIKKVVKIPVAVVGGITSPELAEQLLAEGKCDLVAFGRPLTADPDFANKVMADEGDDIAKCLRCYKCFPGPLEDNLDQLDSIFGCTVNPNAFFYDTELLNRKPERPRNVLIIGGGIAGMEAAVVAHDRGHKVTLLEKTNKLGGLLQFADTDAYKGDLGAFKDLLVRRVKKRGIKVVLNQELTPEAVAAYKPDAAMIAIGSLPVIPPIRGIEHAVKALDVYGDMEKIGGNVIVIGGGLVGCETGLHLTRNGRNVTVVEMQDQVAPDSYVMHRIALVHEMDRRLNYRTGLKCTEITEHGVTVEDGNGHTEQLPCDTVVFALGMRGLAEKADEFAKMLDGIETYKIGDCVKASKVYDAVRQAYVAALSL